MIINKEIAQRFGLLLDKLNMNQGQMSLSMGFKNGNGLSMIMRSKNELNERHLIILENTFNVNRNWLINGVGEPFKTPKSESPPIILSQSTDVSELKQMVFDLLSTVKNQSDSLKDYASASKYNAIDRANDSENMKTLVETNKYLSHKIGEMGESGGVSKKVAMG